MDLSSHILAIIGIIVIFSKDVIGCTQTQGQLEIVTDNYPEDNRWEIKNLNDVIIASGNTFTTEQNSLYVQPLCLEDGLYTFTIRDIYGDGESLGSLKTM